MLSQKRLTLAIAESKRATDNDFLDVLETVSERDYRNLLNKT